VKDIRLGYDIVELQPDDSLGLGFVLVRIHRLYMQKNPGFKLVQVVQVCRKGSLILQSLHSMAVEANF
jgi:hypothetical protein